MAVTKKYRSITEAYGVAEPRDVVFEFVKRGIESGRFKPGEKLPTGHEISEELGGMAATYVSWGIYDLLEAGLLQPKPYANAPAIVAYPAGVEADRATLRQEVDRDMGELAQMLSTPNMARARPNCDTASSRASPRLTRKMPWRSL